MSDREFLRPDHDEEEYGEVQRPGAYGPRLRSRLNPEESHYLRIPVRTTDAVKEPALRNRDGDLLIGHEYTDMVHSFIIELSDGGHLLQCGPWEFEHRYTEEEP